MTLYFSGTVGKSYGLMSAIWKQLREMNLTPVKKIDIAFDPFHDNAGEIRRLSHVFAFEKFKDRFDSCNIKTRVVCDRSEPIVHLHLDDDRNVIFKAAHLNCLEILTLINEHVSIPYIKALPPDPNAKPVKKQRKGHKFVRRERRY